MNLERFSRTMYRRRRRVVALWSLALLGLTVLGGWWGGDHRSDYMVRGSDSSTAFELLEADLPELSGDTVEVVVRSRDGIAPAEVTAELRDQLALIDHVTGVQSPIASPDGRTALLVVRLDDTAEKIPTASIEQLLAIVEQHRSDTIAVEAGGQAVHLVEAAEPGFEQFGMLMALVILLVAFGSVLAAGLPIVVAIFGVGTALAVGSLLNHVFVVPDWAPQLVTMVGIGVGIDYALFIVVRYRSALAEGISVEAAVIQAMSTAGRAVLFAGGTVMISLLGLCAMGLNYLYGVAAVTSVAVLVVLLASITLLPALLGFTGRTIDGLRIPFLGRDRGHDSVWSRWSRVIQRSPFATGIVALVLLVVLALPFGDLRFGTPDAGATSASFTSRRAYDLISESFGPGANGPLVIVADTADEVFVAKLSERLAAQPGVAAVLPALVGSSRSTAALLVIPMTGPQDRRTESLIHDLRDNTIPSVIGGHSHHVYVGGATAVFIDDSAYTSGRLPLFVGAVIALSFLLLLVVFRAPLVALKAALMNLLAIGAAYGVMATALRGGWLGQLIGIDEPTPIPAWAPMMMFALLFGLSMDYEVFLLSRIREEYRRTGDNATAVADGLALTGRVISAAAAIMVAVFAAFILGDDVLIKVIGLGLAVAIALDATLVRMVLVPSTMELLGDRNWWIPRWLDRVLPNIEVEASRAARPPARPGHDVPESLLVG